MSNAYTDALSDPKVQELEPGIIMRPFHQPGIGQEQEFHVYCEKHPAFGFCGVEQSARDAALAHGRKVHR